MPLATALATLETSGLIRLAQSEPELEYLFRHALIQDAAYESLLKADRRVLHRAVGEALEHLYPDHLHEVAPLLGQHFAEAGENEKAAKYLLMAGDRASEGYAYQEAIGHYERALPFLEDQRRAARTLMKLGLLYHALFDFQRSRRAYEEGFALWQQVGEAQPDSSLPPAPHALRAIWFNPHTLDPALAVATSATVVIQHLFSGLVELNPEMEVVPEVARSWEVLEDGRRYVFHLRDDWRWSDGRQVTAEDFEYAWKRVLNPATGSPVADNLYDLKGARAFHRGEALTADGVGVRALDPLTLSVELEGPTGYFLHLLAQTVLYPVPRHIVEAHGAAWTEVEHIATNGPFRLVDWRPGQTMTLTRNPGYRGRFSGNVQQAEVFLREQAFSARLERYEADRADVCYLFSGATPAEAVQARQRHAGEYLSVPVANTFFVEFDLSRPPFNNSRVRQAFTLALDRERLAEVILHGFVAPATGGLVPQGLPGHSPGIGLPYDPDRARQLLAQAGYPGVQGFPIVNALMFRGVEALMEYVTTQWRENLGIEIAWETLVDWARVKARREQAPPHLYFGTWVADYPDPDTFLRGARSRDFSWQWNKAYDNLVEEAQRITHQGKRMQMYQEADRLLVEEAAVLPLLYEREHVLVKPWVSKYPLSAMGMIFWKDVVIEPH